VHVDAEQLAVPLGEHLVEAAGRGVGVVDGQRRALHPLRRLDAGDGAERRGEVDQPDRTVDDRPGGVVRTVRA